MAKNIDRDWTGSCSPKSEESLNIYAEEHSGASFNLHPSQIWKFKMCKDDNGDYYYVIVHQKRQIWLQMSQLDFYQFFEER